MYNVLTPAGVIKVNSAAEALHYKQAYGYPYVKEQKEEEEQSVNLSEIEDYTIQSYGVLIPIFKTVTARKFAELIKTTYDLDEPRNKACYDSVKDKKYYITHDHTGYKVNY